jgi:hypothetical protein
MATPFASRLKTAETMIATATTRSGPGKEQAPEGAAQCPGPNQALSLLDLGLTFHGTDNDGCIFKGNQLLLLQTLNGTERLAGAGFRFKGQDK